MSDEFDFHMEVVEKDREGYYYVRWDRATPLTVRAENRASAFSKAWAVMGDCPRGRGWVWTARIKRIESVPVPLSPVRDGEKP